MNNPNKIDFTKIKTYSIVDRTSKVQIRDCGTVLNRNPSFSAFLNSLPRILAADDFSNFLKRYISALRHQGQITYMLGAHVIKVGLNLLFIDAIQQGWIGHLALNGACIIHDVELALWGKTSENVAKGIEDGSFGMARESTSFINNAVRKGRDKKLGYGESVAHALSESKGPHLDHSILVAAFRHKIPVTVHSAIGTEIIHQHSGVDGAAIGETSWTDFQIFCEQISHLNKYGMVLNIGSAVILPEVFLKALTVVRNLGFKARAFTTATFDMIRQYRPAVNVVQRPTQKSGKGYYFIGHHELLIPILFAALKSSKI